jgi:type 1 fimbriae regulatory protein FimB/type 1 fimbriae regulatory protein FimE
VAHLGQTVIIFSLPWFREREFMVHPHMLRHACGYALANKGIDTRTLQAYLGHRSIKSTTRYAALAPGRFKNIWGKV